MPRCRMRTRRRRRGSSAQCGLRTQPSPRDDAPAEGGRRPSAVLLRGHQDRAAMTAALDYSAAESSTLAWDRTLLESIALYLHVPFCHAKCHYCDFNSYAGMLGLREQYVEALLAEIALAGARARQTRGALRRCRTIFFGSGTPSLLTA